MEVPEEESDEEVDRKSLCSLAPKPLEELEVKSKKSEIAEDVESNCSVIVKEHGEYESEDEEGVKDSVRLSHGSLVVAGETRDFYYTSPIYTKHEDNTEFSPSQF